MSEWGSVQGDERARALVASRRSLSLTYSWSSTLVGAAALAAGIWYGFTTNAWALAATVLLTGLTVSGKVVSEVFDHRSSVIANELRLRLLEEQLQNIAEELRARAA